MVASNGRTTQQIIKHRLRSSEKGKRRNVDITAAFYNLQCKIPELQTNQPLPRIKTLRLAIGYIQWLQNQLSGTPTLDFSQVVARVIQEKNSYSERTVQEAGEPQPTNVQYYQPPPFSSESQMQPVMHFSQVPFNFCSSPDSQQSSSP